MIGPIPAAAAHRYEQVRRDLLRSVELAVALSAEAEAYIVPGNVLEHVAWKAHFTDVWTRGPIEGWPTTLAQAIRRGRAAASKTDTTPEPTKENRCPSPLPLPI